MMYSALSAIYDRLAYDFDCSKWTDRYLELLKHNAPALREVCDVGCGTGGMAIELSKRGYLLTAIDLSGDMLSVASDKARKAHARIAFSKQDMRSFTLPHAVDGVFSACDGVNYLLKEEGAAGFFKSAINALKPGGAFAFDISSPGKLKAMAEQQRYFEETDELAYIWLNELNGDKLNMEISFFVKCPDGRYERFHETHRQRLWEKGELSALIEGAGFENVQCLDEGDRIYFWAKKPV